MSRTPNQRVPDMSKGGAKKSQKKKKGETTQQLGD